MRLALGVFGTTVRWLNSSLFYSSSMYISLGSGNLRNQLPKPLQPKHQPQLPPKISADWISSTYAYYLFLPFALSALGWVPHHAKIKLKKY